MFIVLFLACTDILLGSSFTPHEGIGTQGFNQGNIIREPADKTETSHIEKAQSNISKKKRKKPFFTYSLTPDLRGTATTKIKKNKKHQTEEKKT